jgi:uncharacterized protein
MRITVEQLESKHRIQAYGPEGIRVADTVHTGTLVLTADSVIGDWPGPLPAALDEASLDGLLQPDPEVLLIGTGTLAIALPDSLLVPLQCRGIGLEVMATGPACRTYNVLLSEQRVVVALLYPE